MSERSKYEAVLDVRYGFRFGEMNERFYRRLDLLFGFIGLFGGSAAVVGAIATYPILSLSSGAMVAAFAVIERLVRPVEKAIDHANYKKRFADLDARASKLSLDDLDSELRRLQADAPMGINSLAIPAFNANLRSNGRGDLSTQVSYWSRFIALLA